MLSKGLKRALKPETPAGRWLGFVIILLFAGLLRLPALEAPFALDDHAQRAMAEARLPVPLAPLNLFDFIADGHRASLLDSGAIPWWSQPELKVRFLRPLSSFLTWLDWRLFGYDAWFPHLHSLAWWVSAVAAANVLFFRVLAPQAAMLASLAFAVADCHSIPLVWLANRSVLVTVTFGALACAAYVGSLNRDDPRKLLSGAGLFTLALLSGGEYAIGFGGYILALELGRRHDKLRRRLARLSVFALPALLYTALHLALRYGVEASGLYRDPFHEFERFAAEAPRALAVLFGSVWLGLNGSYWANAEPGSLVVLVALATLGLSALVYRTVDSERRAPVLWMLIGSTLALLPVLATEPSPRVLGVAALGVSATVGSLIQVTWSRLRAGLQIRGAARVGAVAAVGLAYVRFVAAPLESDRAMREILSLENEFDTRFQWVREQAQGVTASPKTLVFVRAISPPIVLWAPFMLPTEAGARVRVLSQVSGTPTLVRSGSRTLHVISDGQPLFPTGPADMFRDSNLTVGHTVQISGMQATVVQVDTEGRPTQLRYEFDRDLDDPSFRWIAEGQAGFNPFEMPKGTYDVRLAP